MSEQPLFHYRCYNVCITQSTHLITGSWHHISWVHFSFVKDTVTCTCHGKCHCDILIIIMECVMIKTIWFIVNYLCTKYQEMTHFMITFHENDETCQLGMTGCICDKLWWIYLDGQCFYINHVDRYKLLCRVARVFILPSTSLEVGDTCRTLWMVVCYPNLSTSTHLAL